MDPYFPPELEREIFETSAVLYPETIPSLLLVAHRVLTWIEPFLYRVISVIGHEEPAFLPALRTKPAGFLRKAVRHVFADMRVSTHMSDLGQVLDIALDVESLTVFPATSEYLLERLKPLHLKRLAILLEPVFHSDDLTVTAVEFTLPMFASITHLDLFDGISDSAYFEHWTELAALPALTHLALSTLCDVLRGAKHVLGNSKTIKILVSMDPSDPEDDAPVIPERVVNDDRFVFMALSTAQYQEDWHVGARGGVDFWARAERFVEKKRRKEIEPRSRHWILPEDGI
ncbi:hypothetical protein FB45DRAFT_929345 [Roridomyces roridus]|uniref:Uncharacterized protein n=1 Tax=Roridomyces roridus TaxID=1738132 RepID=A0AAD7B1M0_9AGAR|nr:hypothetical protein FB45DRAFT_948534 [Roridomyces roridus]KAJ7621497.1 hypothetical protein FB45DRAFT_929345 [Roridomyces roridus]